MPLRAPGRAASATLAAALCALALSGCTGGSGAVSTDSGTERFRSGDGVATYVVPDRRQAGPDLSGTGLDGAPLTLAGVRGDGPVVVNVWGSWCAPCKAEQGTLERVWRATRSRGVTFLGINVRDPSRTPARRHVARFHVTYPSIYDPASRLLPRFKVAAKTIPTTYVLDRRGRIAVYAYGPVDERALTTLLDRVLAET
jgi:thiol-disulfide isomerase/thioredoxin